MNTWLAARTPEFREAVEVVVIDPHAGYAAVRAALPEAQVAVASKPRRFVNTGVG